MPFSLEDVSTNNAVTKNTVIGAAKPLQSFVLNDGETRRFRVRFRATDMLHTFVKVTFQTANDCKSSTSFTAAAGSMYSSLAKGFIRVNAPNGGEVLTAGSTGAVIRWSGVLPATPVTLEYLVRCCSRPIKQLSRPRQRGNWRI
jgi:hypothetical protein